MDEKQNGAAIGSLPSGGTFQKLNDEDRANKHVIEQAIAEIEFLRSRVDRLTLVNDRTERLLRLFEGQRQAGDNQPSASITDSAWALRRTLERMEQKGPDITVRLPDFGHLLTKTKTSRRKRKARR